MATKTSAPFKAGDTIQVGWDEGGTTKGDKSATLVSVDDEQEEAIFGTAKLSVDLDDLKKGSSVEVAYDLGADDGWWVPME